jgi:hypothetical protein
MCSNVLAFAACACTLAFLDVPGIFAWTKIHLSIMIPMTALA